MRACLPVARKVVLFSLALLVVSSLAYAQGGSQTTTLSGTVADAQRAVIPGADVVVRNNATNAESRAVTDAKGDFVVPGLAPGTYTLTVSLMGFKTFVSPDVKMLAGTPETVKVTLQVGAIEETVLVSGATEIMQTQSATVQTTLQVNQLQQLPLATHTALDSILSLPGVNTTGSNTRGSTINNLPNRAMNITMDGINVQDNRSSGEGFFMYIRPMMDSVEEITVSTSTPGAESMGSGAAQIKMVTRSGSNRFSGAAYNSWRNQAGTNDTDTLARTKKGGWQWGLNTPYWFNKRDRPKTAAGEYYIDDIRLQTPGFRLGGPAIKDKLFYFGNVEWFMWPNSASRIRYFLKQDAANGLFRYKDNSGATQTFNLLALAASKGQTPTVDPTLAKMFADIRQAAGTEGGIDSTAELNVEKYSYSPTGSQFRYFPTARVDYNISPSHRVSGVFRWNHFGGQPDVLNGNESPFPGFPNRGGQGSERYFWQAALRSTLGKSIVNEFLVGSADATGMGTYFSVGVNEDMFNCTGLGCQSIGGKGYAFNFPGANNVASVGLTNPYVSFSPSADVAKITNFEDTLTWLKGAHTISTGVTFTHIVWRGWSDRVVEADMSFGIDSRDPAYSMFDSASGNYPGGIDATQAGYARNLYALITGRVSAINGSYYWDGSQYSFNGVGGNGAIFDSLGGFVSDSWRLKPSLTLTGGVRYEVQFPIKDNWGYSAPQNWEMVYGLTGAGSGPIGQGNMFKPGTLTGQDPTFVKYDNSTPAYKTDWNNLGPSVGAAWRPSVKAGFLSTLLSDAPVIRGGYSMSFTKYATDFYTGIYGNNPGWVRPGSRGFTTGSPTIGSDGFPVLLRDTARLTPGTAPAALAYPFAPATTNDSFRAMSPNQPVPYTHQYSVGLQRELGKNRSTAIEIRYVGNTNVGETQTWNINDSANWSMLAGENGFYDEFRKAQANLRANILAGNGTTFAYTGAPGTAPLPIFQAFFAGTAPGNTASNGNAANYTSANYRTAAWYNSLNYYNPAITTISGLGTNGLQSTAFDANRIAAGLPANVFRANTYMGSGSTPQIRTIAGSRRFNAFQLELRRRMSGGLMAGASYQRQFSLSTNTWRSLREASPISVDSASSPLHAIKANWVYQLPFGQGRKWGSGVGKWKNTLVGGWEFDGVLRSQSGDRFNFGNYRLVGMTEDEFKKMFKFYHVPDAAGLDRIYMLPRGVIEQSIIALFRTDPTNATGYANGIVPTGQYLAPASGTDCVQYLAGTCPGTSLVRIVNGPWGFRADFSFVKRFDTGKGTRIEARMDLFNVFNNVNFVARAPTGGTGAAPSFSTTGTGSALSNWEVTQAATDLSASQDPGGRITQFSLRFTW
jgi:hypothetical protein